MHAPSARSSASRSSRSMIEILEHRRLLSWTTVDDFVQPLADPQGQFPESYALPYDMAADSAGGVYVGGESWDYSLYPNDRGYALLRYKSGTSSEFQTIAAVQTSGIFVARFDGVAVAPDDSVYLCGLKGRIGTAAQYRIWKGTWDTSGTTFSLAEVDSQSTISWKDITVDGAGNVFALGQYTASQGGGVVRWVVRKQTGGQGAFVTVNDFVYANNVSTYPSAITAVWSGPNAGVYVIGRTNSQWLVRTSTNAGSTWSTVDNFQLDSNASSAAMAITAHDDGTVHVVGRAAVRVQTGGTAKKPVYSIVSRWHMRSSNNGGASWTNHNVYPESAGAAPDGLGVITDQSGNVYVAGSFSNRAIVRTNAGGTWSTSDDFQLFTDQYTAATCMTRDAAGAVYFGGVADEGPPDYTGHWIVRSTSSAAAASGGAPGFFGARPRSLFSTERLGDARDELLVELS